MVSLFWYFLVNLVRLGMIYLSVSSTWGINIIKNDPELDSIREETEFQQIVREVEAKYQAEHEGTRKWLEEHGML